MNRRRLKRVRLVFAVVLCLLIVIMLLHVDDVQSPPPALSRDLDESYGQRHRWHVGLFRPLRYFHNDTVPLNVNGSEPVWIPSFPKPDASFRSGSSKDAIDNGRLDVKNAAVRLSKQMDYPKESIFVKSLQEAKDMHISFDGQRSSATLSAKKRDLRKSELHSDDGEEIEKEISERPTQEKQQLQRLIVVYEKPWFVQTSAQVDFTACDPSTCALSYDPSDLPSARAVVFDALRLDQTTPPPHPRPPGQLWVLYFLEPPPVLKRHEDDVLPPAWRGVFNLTWSYRSDSDIFCPYGAVVPKNSDDSYWRRLLKNDGANVRHGTVLLKRGARAMRVASGNDTSRERLLLKTSGVVRRQSTKPSPGVVPPGRHRGPKPSTNNAVVILSKGQAPSKLPHSRPDFSKLFRTESGRGDDEFGDSNSAFPRTPSPHFLRVAARKTRGAVWLVSHCGAESARDQYVERLQRRLDVDVYGRCSGQRCGNNQKCLSFINTTYR